MMNSMQCRIKPSTMRKSAAIISCTQLDSSISTSRRYAYRMIFSSNGPGIPTRVVSCFGSFKFVVNSTLRNDIWNCVKRKRLVTWNIRCKRKSLPGARWTLPPSRFLCRHRRAGCSPASHWAEPSLHDWYNFVASLHCLLRSKARLQIVVDSNFREAPTSSEV